MDKTSIKAVKEALQTLKDMGIEYPEELTPWQRKEIISALVDLQYYDNDEIREAIFS